ncbi:hypothetical protein B0I35DRAFT_113186 [Stachybotrys elegans]|uniref:Uncharacterized protein n=1 Tax=Stachybotrys elegans TaxID=80388 RepID=A0A8K0SET6_9HYPO|nr:hypothetical protein B0I35DRAFT_113186 [Stachybotrys elegans]
MLTSLLSPLPLFCSTYLWMGAMVYRILARPSPPSPATHVKGPGLAGFIREPRMELIVVAAHGRHALADPRFNAFLFVSLPPQARAPKHSRRALAAAAAPEISHPSSPAPALMQHG